MSDSSELNGHHRLDQRDYTPDADLCEPQEIVDFERATDPYANMLPGLANVHAARTLGHGVEVGRRGRPWVLVVSIILIAVLVLPAVLAVLAELSH